MADVVMTCRHVILLTNFVRQMYAFLIPAAYIRYLEGIEFPNDKDEESTI